MWLNANGMSNPLFKKNKDGVALTVWNLLIIYQNLLCQATQTVQIRLVTR